MNLHLHLPPRALHQGVLHPHSGAIPGRCRPLQDLPSTAGLPKHVCFNLTPIPPAAADPGTFFLGTPARFFACPGEASSSRYLQHNRGQPAWQQDYTFFAASCDQEAGGSSVGTPPQGLPTPLLPSLVHHVMTSQCPVRDDRTAPCTNQFFTFVHTVL
jgi:hypothetical protein